MILVSLIISQLLVNIWMYYGACPLIDNVAPCGHVLTGVRYPSCLCSKSR